MSLTINRHIVPQQWMRAPETVLLFDTLQGNTAKDKPQALFVGGCVRNIILGHKVEDFDIATPLLPDDVVQILKNAGIRVIPTGLQHGTVTALIGEYSYEITTLRHDKETDGRRAVVSYTDSWIEDAKRRDFTINTLLMDLVGNVYDPLGGGIKDSDERIVRFVGDAAQRIEEDHLRILRFFRFSALYGNKFDENGLVACQKSADTIKKLSKERITQEFFKIIASDKPWAVLDVMFKHDVLKAFCFPDYNADFFEHFCTFQSRYKLSALSSRLFVFAACNFENIKAMEQFVMFPKVFLRDMQAIKGAMSLPDLSCDHAVRVSVYRFGRSITAQVLMAELALDRVMNQYAPQAIDIIQHWDIPTFPISGHDLIEKGFENGPTIGHELSRLENAWIDNGFQ